MIVGLGSISVKEAAMVDCAEDGIFRCHDVMHS